MLEEIVTWLRGQFGTNDFLVGTTVPFVLGAIVYGAKRAVTTVYQYLVRNFTVSMRINSDTEKFIEVNQYVYDNFVWGIFKRNFVLSWLWGPDTLNMTSGYGRSIALVNGYPGFVELTSEESDSNEFKEYLEIKVLTHRPSQMAERLFAELRDHLKKSDEKKTVKIFKSALSDRNLVAKKPLRSLDTIFMPKQFKDRVVGALRKFIDSREAYELKGLPYHMGMILHGPPGTGKTSFIHALASELGRDVHYHSSGSLAHVHVDPDSTILVLEDFDSADFKTSDDGEEDKTVVSTLTDTLNFLDGFLTPHGLIVIATTNHLDRIDAAVMRPGRFDIVEEVPVMQLEQYRDMCEFYGVECDDEEFEPGSGAKLMAQIKADWSSADAV